jgi:hypothetical protein
MRNGKFCILVVGFLFASTQVASGDGLFRPANVPPGAARTLPDSGLPQSLEITRTTILTADPVYIRSRMAPSGTANLPEAERKAALSRLPPDLKVSLFPDVLLTLRRYGLFAYSHRPQAFRWYGETDLPSNCGAYLDVDDGVLGGDIECAGLNRSYYITHIEGHLYRIYEVIRPRDMVGFCDTDDEEGCRRQTESLCKELRRLGSSISRGDRRLRTDLCSGGRSDP